MLILRLLAETDTQSGSALADIIEERVGNRPSPGTLYPMLDRMADDGLIEKEKIGRENQYTLTEEGEASIESFANENEEHLNGIIRSMRQHKEIFGQEELQATIDRLERMRDGEFPESKVESILHDVDIRIQSQDLSGEKEQAIIEKLKAMQNILEE